MKNELFTFEINKDQEMKIVKMFSKHINISSKEEINILMDQLEKDICIYIMELFRAMVKYFENEKENNDYDMFLNELDKYKK